MASVSGIVLLLVSQSSYAVAGEAQAGFSLCESCINELHVGSPKSAAKVIKSALDSSPDESDILIIWLNGGS